MSSVYRAIIQRRTIRRFKQKKIPRSLLKKLVNAGRLAPSAANLQPLEFLVIDKKELRERLFPYLNWAGYISPLGNPPVGKRPTAYILILINKKKENPLFTPYDVGASAENIILTAWELGIGTCWVKSLDREKISALINLPKNLILDSVLALGYRDEMPRLEVWRNSVKYWKDKAGCLHVPKRRLSDVLHINSLSSSIL
ncbi:MAG: nitroreductase family protein [Candidatus Omnitrophica bacterium]|nr:nitroreductase family protein [Candidatus Omnitrophota bacterium]MCM8793147.1 nitroreductase family protein [Candidatus Omnitrophota bacterium]